MLRGRALLFDSDGVLVDSHALVEAAWCQIAAEYDLDAEHLLSNCAGVRAVDLLRSHVRESDLVAVEARFEEIEVGLASKVSTLPGAKDLLKSLAQIPWAVVTSGSRRLASARWGGAGIQQPPASITADDVSSGKPDPEPYARAAALLRVDPSECVVFEDSPSGGIAARAAGCAVVAVGSQAWDMPSDGRVADLRSVSVQVADDGHVRVTLANGASSLTGTVPKGPVQRGAL